MSRNNNHNWESFNEERPFDLQDEKRINIIANQFLAVLPLGFPKDRVVAALVSVRPYIDCEDYHSNNLNVRLSDLAQFKKIISLLK